MRGSCNKAVVCCERERGKTRCAACVARWMRVIRIGRCGGCGGCGEPWEYALLVVVVEGRWDYVILQIRQGMLGSRVVWNDEDDDVIFSKPRCLLRDGCVGCGGCVRAAVDAGIMQRGRCGLRRVRMLRWVAYGCGEPQRTIGRCGCGSWDGACCRPLWVAEGCVWMRGVYVRAAGDAEDAGGNASVVVVVEGALGLRNPLIAVCRVMRVLRNVFGGTARAVV